MVVLAISVELVGVARAGGQLRPHSGLGKHGRIECLRTEHREGRREREGREGGREEREEREEIVLQNISDKTQMYL